MKILDFFKGIFKSREPPQNSSPLSVSPFLFGRSQSGATVTDITAIQNSVVFACVRILAESIASLPLHVYEYRKEGKEKVPSHPLYYVLHDAPNEEMTSFNFREMLMLNMLIYGNGYARIERDPVGRVKSLYPLRSKQMTVIRDDRGEIRYRYMPAMGEKRWKTAFGEEEYRKHEILHVPALGFDGLIGYSPIAIARNAIGVSLACEEFGSKFFENDARPSGILKVPHVLKDPEKLRESWQRAFSGENHGKTAVLEEGVEYETISIPPDDAQFLETRKFQIAEIARIFRVPLHLLNELDRATFNNITQLSLEFVMYTLTPWLVRLEQNFNKALLRTKERGRYFVKFSVEGLLRGDYDTRTKGYQTALQSGWLSVNEVRELEDLNALSESEGGEYHLVNGNMAKLKDAGVAYEKKAGDKNG